jgi:hypothetical protein
MTFDWSVIFQIVTVMCLGNNCSFHSAPCGVKTKMGTLIINTKTKAVVRICSAGDQGRLIIDRKAQR